MQKFFVTNGVARHLVVLTPREREVLRLLAKGLPNKEIAFQLGLTVSTAKTYVGDLIRDLEFENRVQVAHWAWINPKALEGHPTDLRTHLLGCPCQDPRCQAALKTVTPPDAETT